MRHLLYPLMIIVAATTAMIFPAPFTELGGFSLKRLIVPLLQIIMLGMGATMSWRDFAAVARQPRAVVIGVVCQFTIMPLLGVSLARLFQFPNEIAAGVVLIGCSPS